MNPRPILHPDLVDLTLVDVMRGFADHVRLHLVMTIHHLGECECALVHAPLGSSNQTPPTTCAS